MALFSCILVPNIQYADNSTQRQSMDLYLPTSAEKPLPLIINIHGGGWNSGDKGALNAEAFFVETGYAYLRTNYRYSTEAPHPAQVEDLQLVLEWIAAHSAEYGIDTQRVYTIGHSAGGHLASLLALMPWDKPAVCIRAVVNQAGPTDLPYALQRKQKPEDYSMENLSMLDQLLGCQALENLDFAMQASPIHYVDKDTPPHLLIMGEDDEVVPAEHGRRFHEKMLRSRAHSELAILPGAGHVHPSFWQRENFERILAFYERHR